MTVAAGQPKMTILNLPLAVGVDGAELVPCAQNGTTVRTTISDISNFSSVILTSALGSAVTFGAGARRIITDFNGAMVFKSVVTSTQGGGVPSFFNNTVVPVFSDGTDWRQG